MFTTYSLYRIGFNNIPRHLIWKWTWLLIINIYLSYLCVDFTGSLIVRINSGNGIELYPFYILIVELLAIFISYAIGACSDEICARSYKNVYAAVVRRYLDASTGNQRDQSAEFGNKIGGALNLVNMLSWMIPNLISFLVRLAGDLILVVRDEGFPTEFVYLVGVCSSIIAALIYYIAPRITKNNDITNTRNGELDDQKAIEISAINNKSIHGEADECPEKISNIVYSIEANWSITYLHNNILTSGSLALIDVVVVACLYMSYNVSYVYWRLLMDVSGLAHQLFSNWTQYDKQRSKLGEFDEYCSKFDISKRKDVEQVAYLGSFTIQQLEYERIKNNKAVYTLQLKRPITIIHGRPRLVLVKGPNGAGKSTFFDILIGAIELSKPQIIMDIDGVDVPHGCMHILGKRIVLMQNTSEQIDRQTWTEFISSGATYPDIYLVKLLIVEVGLSRANFDVDEKICRLSGGETRRLLLARILYQLRNLSGAITFVILDELDASVDDIDEEDRDETYKPLPNIINGIRRWYNGTVFLSLHNKSFIDQIHFDDVLNFRKHVGENVINTVIVPQ